ncbi:hypothetical protein PR202_gb07001 [Eleusine coracana subsp. coracana]|uniref:CRAL-TRIO domain-containing protein n=1 Tax=Eleusine coracana subsp. coracana TaxID=191504 RepID=A0AAV5EB26_ELECO|nr:hypothetical protein PR202_gb07001 [Eleusine coracana subsp. coracana]
MAAACSFRSVARAPPVLRGPAARRVRCCHASPTSAASTSKLVSEVKERLEREHPGLPTGRNGRDDEDMILWFLKDRKFSVDETVSKLTKAIENGQGRNWRRIGNKWRQDFNVAELSEESVKGLYQTGKAYVHDSLDIYGRPVLVVVAAKHFPSKQDPVENEKLCAYLVEMALSRLPLGTENILGIFDLRGFGVENGDLQFLKFLIDVFYYYYPKRLGQCKRSTLRKKQYLLIFAVRCLDHLSKQLVWKLRADSDRTGFTRNGKAHGQPVPASMLGLTRHKKPTRLQGQGHHYDPHCLSPDPDPLLAPMGLCLSVALWKEKLYVDRGHNDVAGVKAVGCDYEVLGGDDVLEPEEKVVVEAAPAAAMGVKHGAEGATAVSGGTPSRPIWQRKVLMGVRCQLPRFSGMILYDESGRPVCSGVRDRARELEKHAAAIAVLRDML